MFEKEWQETYKDVQGTTFFFTMDCYKMSSLFIWWKVSTKKLQAITLIETYTQVVTKGHFIPTFASSTFGRGLWMCALVWVAWNQVSKKQGGHYAFLQRSIK